MQVKIIALAIAGLMSSAAFAQSSVVIGGKFDAGYQFKRTANADTAGGGATGGSTTETLGDGGASTSRITVQAKEDLGSGWNAMVDLDLRFGTIEEGKNPTTASAGGVNSNDKKALYLGSPFGTMRWGVMNLVSAQYWDYEEKPYMVNIKDLEIVKYGIYQKRFTSLTDRATEYDTPILTIGPVSNRLKGTFAFGANQKGGTNNNDSTPATGPQGSGNVYQVAETGAYGKWVNWTASTAHRVSTSNLQASRNGMTFQEYELNVHPMDGLKLGASYANYKGFGDAASLDVGGTYHEKGTNFVVAYNYGSLFQVGIERSHLNDVGSSRNSGVSTMIGGSYFMSKSTYLYAAWEKDNYARNSGTSSGGFDGTKAGFIGSFSKVDMDYTRFGIVKEF